MQRSYSPMFQSFQPHDSIIVSGLFLIISEVIILIIFFVGGTAILAALQGIFSFSNVVPQLSEYSPLITTCFYLMFAIAFLIPIAWFFAVIMRKEQGFQFGRVY